MTDKQDIHSKRREALDKMTKEMIKAGVYDAEVQQEKQELISEMRWLMSFCIVETVYLNINGTVEDVELMKTVNRAKEIYKRVTGEDYE